MIIAQRDVVIDRLTNPVSVPISIEQPVHEGGRWRCTFEIGWPDKPLRRWMSGFDSMAAIVNTLKLIGTELYASAYHQSGRLSWNPDGGYGFPLPPYMLDAAVGADAQY